MNFNEDGLLPPKDYLLTFEELRNSILVKGPTFYKTWDAKWRLTLVENLEIMVKQLWEIGIDQIYIDGSFVEDKAHPNDIDGYFECDLLDLATGDLERMLNALDPYKVWTWDSKTRKPYRGYTKNSYRCGIGIELNYIPMSDFLLEYEMSLGMINNFPLHFERQEIHIYQKEL